MTKKSFAGVAPSRWRPRPIVVLVVAGAVAIAGIGWAIEGVRPEIGLTPEEAAAAKARERASRAGTPPPDAAGYERFAAIDPGSLTDAVEEESEEEEEDVEEEIEVAGGDETPSAPAASEAREAPAPPQWFVAHQEERRGRFLSAKYGELGVVTIDPPEDAGEPHPGIEWTSAAANGAVCLVPATGAIQARLDHVVDGDGEARAVGTVTEHVWEREGGCLAFPAGTKIELEVAKTGPRDDRVTLTPTALVRPHPRADRFRISGMVVDADGRGRVPGDVETHGASKTAAGIVDAGTRIGASVAGATIHPLAGVLAGGADTAISEWARRKMDEPNRVTVDPRRGKSEGHFQILLEEPVMADEFRT